MASQPIFLFSPNTVLGLRKTHSFWDDPDCLLLRGSTLTLSDGATTFSCSVENPTCRAYQQEHPARVAAPPLPHAIALPPRLLLLRLKPNTRAARQLTVRLALAHQVHRLH